MKKIWIICLLVFLSSANSWAFRSDAFKGWYDLLSGTRTTKGMLFDVDTLEVIWSRYADGPLPANLQPYHLEPTILVAFNFRDIYFLSFESKAMISNNLVALNAGAGDHLELRRRPDGNFDLAVIEKGKPSVYVVSGPHPR